MAQHLATPWHEGTESLVFQIPLRARFRERLRVDGKPPLAERETKRNSIRGYDAGSLGAGSLGAVCKLHVHL
jgi:hypothetical protein